MQKRNSNQMSVLRSAQSVVTIHATYVDKQFHDSQYYNREVLWCVKLNDEESVPHVPRALAFDQGRRTIRYARCGQDLQQHGALSEADGWIVITGIARFLASIHALNLIHGDMKAENVLFCRRNSKVQVIDYATMQRASPVRGRGACLLGGTQYCLALEQYKGMVYRATDVWAFGILITELMFNNCVFVNDNGQQMAIHTINTALENKSRRAIRRTFKTMRYFSDTSAHTQPWVASLQRLLHRMLEIHHTKRPTMQVVLRELQRIKRMWQDKDMRDEPSEEQSRCCFSLPCTLL